MKRDNGVFLLDLLAALREGGGADEK